MMTLDILIFVLLAAGFGLVTLFTNWCEKQVNR